MEFIEYESSNSRSCALECEDEKLLSEIRAKPADKAKYANIPRPALLTECRARPYRRCCETEYVCHTTALENAVKILECGRLLSAVKARSIPAEKLMKESRNAAKDPADYFDYIMLSWGNCQAGDRLVMERKLKRFPAEADLSERFEPGIRFYFQYDTLIRHPNAVCDGVLPMKIKNEIILSDWVYKIVIPVKLRGALEEHVPDSLKDRILYIENDCRNICDWSEKVYRPIEKCGR